LDWRFLVEPALFGFEENPAAQCGEEGAGSGGLGVGGPEKIEESGRLLRAHSEDAEAVAVFEIEAGEIWG
jgi:hypothetical protein